MNNLTKSDPQLQRTRQKLNPRHLITQTNTKSRILKISRTRSEPNHCPYRTRKKATTQNFHFSPPFVLTSILANRPRKVSKGTITHCWNDIFKGQTPSWCTTYSVKALMTSDYRAEQYVTHLVDIVWHDDHNSMSELSSKTATTPDTAEHQCDSHMSVSK